MRPVTIPHCRRLQPARVGWNYIPTWTLSSWVSGRECGYSENINAVNKGLFGNGEYFSAANYPLNPGMFKSVSWGFYDWRIVRGELPAKQPLC